MENRYINHYGKPTATNYCICMFCMKIIKNRFDWCEECEKNLEENFDKLILAQENTVTKS